MRDTMYFAGLFDGEGCIHIANGSLQIAVAMTDASPVQAFAKYFGLKVYSRVPIGGTRPIHKAYACGYKATKVLIDLAPNLLNKRAQAMLAIKYALQTTDNRGRGRAVHPTEIALRKDYSKKLSALKKVAT